MINYELKDTDVREHGATSIHLSKTDTHAVWMLTVPDRAPYPSVDNIADTALLRYRPDVVSPVSWFRVNRTSWIFSLSQRMRMPLSKAVQSMSRDPDTGYRILSKTMEAVEIARDYLLPIIPELLHPELLQIECSVDESDVFDVRIVTLPIAGTGRRDTQRETGLIEWMGEVFHWDDSVITQFTTLFRKEAFFDLLLETKNLCGELDTPVGNKENGNACSQRPDRSVSFPSDHHENMLNGKYALPTENDSPGGRIASSLKRLWESLFGYQNHDTIHEVTEELDLSSDRFKIAQLSEGLPGTPDEELGHHAYILTEEFVIGRDLGKSDFRIDSFSVSRRHAVIRRRAGSYFVEDLGSKNGTMLDGVRLSKYREYLLPEKCKISFADHVYYFRSA